MRKLEKIKDLENRIKVKMLSIEALKALGYKDFELIYDYQNLAILHKKLLRVKKSL